MLAASVPTKFQIPFANSAGTGYIRNVPQASQIGITAGAASLTDGFPPVCFQPVGAGGTPPSGQDFNGLMKQLSQWAQWQSAGAPIYYDPTFSSNIGGYPAGTILSAAASLGNFWLSTVDNNTSDPDTGGANWVGFSAATSASLVHIGTDTSSTPNAIVATVSPPITSYQLGVEYNIKIANNVTGATVANLSGLGNKNVVRPDGTPLLGGDCPAGMVARMVYDGTNLQLSVVAPEAFVQKLSSAATTFYVNFGTGSDSNPGTISLPFKTIQGAVNYIGAYDAPSVTINVAAGTYPGFSIGPTLIAHWNIVGAGYATTIVDATSTVSGTGQGCNVSAANVTIGGFTWTAYYECVVVGEGGSLQFSTTLSNAFIGFGATTVAMAAYYASSITVQTNVITYFSGTFFCIFAGTSAGLISTGYNTVFQTYNPVFNFGTTTVAYVVYMLTAATIIFLNGFVSFTGSTPTGQRFYCASNGGVQVLGGGTSFIPGTIAGSAAQSTTISSVTGVNAGYYYG